MTRVTVAAVLAALAVAAGAGAQTNLDLQRDAAIEARLRVRSPETAALWREAAQARYRRQWSEAAAVYEEILARDPMCGPARWAQALVEMERGNRTQAFRLAQGAAAADAETQALANAALALILSRRSHGRAPSDQDKHMAQGLLQGASGGAILDDRLSTAEVLAVHAWACRAALDLDDVAAAAAFLAYLDAPGRRSFDLEAPEVVACRGGLLVAQGRSGDGERLLELAKARAAQEVAANLARLPASADRPRRERTRRVAPPGRPGATQEAATAASAPWTPLDLVEWTLGLWIGMLLALLAAGTVLGRAVLRTADALARGSKAPQGGSALKRVYAGVLWATCAYYYASLPLLAALTLTVGGGLLYVMFAAGRVPVKLALLVLLMTLATLWAILRSLFVRGRDEDPGQHLDLRRHPRLRRLLHDVARRIGTRPVDGVYLTPGTEVAVFERGGLGRQLRGATERCLVLGVGVLDGFLVGPFKAVLGHEYGHFSNRDTAGGGFALAVRRSLLTMAHGLAESGAAAWYNPVWLFLNGFYRVFLRISQGASRLQEILADRWAALSYGSKAFEEGLRHVVERSVRFDANAPRALAGILARSGAPANLYEAPAEPEPPDPDVEQAVRAALTAPPSPYDSHPSPMDRTRWVRALNAPGQVVTPEDGEPAWNLFTDPLSIQLQMTDAVRRMVTAAA